MDGTPPRRLWGLPCLQCCHGRALTTWEAGAGAEGGLGQVPRLFYIDRDQCGCVVGLGQAPRLSCIYRDRCACVVGLGQVPCLSSIYRDRCACVVGLGQVPCPSCRESWGDVMHTKWCAPALGACAYGRFECLSLPCPLLPFPCLQTRKFGLRPQQGEVAYRAHAFFPERSSLGLSNE